MFDKNRDARPYVLQGDGRDIEPPKLRLAEAWSPWLQKMDKASKYLSRVLDRPVNVDEIAVLFPSKESALEWVSEQVEQPLVTHFNASNDHVYTSPITSEYGVRYDFLSVGAPGMGPRVEAMHLLHGHSPIHEAAMHQMEMSQWGWAQPHPFHLSFKCEDQNEYIDTCNRLQAADLVLVQGCRSTYGVFSYWSTTDPEMESVPLYLKPRANLRDAR